MQSEQQFPFVQFQLVREKNFCRASAALCDLFYSKRTFQWFSMLFESRSLDVKSKSVGLIV